MNIYDIAKRAGVSIATVSRVINGNSYVSQKTKEKVMKVMEDCSYTPNAFARGLGLNSMHIVGIMCATSSDPYLASAINFLEQELRRHNYDSLLCCTGYDLIDKQNYLSLLLSKKTDGIILVGSNFVEADSSKNQYIRNAAKKVPIIILNGSLDGENIYCTMCDDYQAVYEATKALIESGSKEILYLYNAISYSGNKKLAGFQAAIDLLETGNKKRNDNAHYVNGSIAEVKDYLTSLKKKGHTFDAIVTSDDSLAIAAIKYAKENNLSVPEDLSVVGYNNSFIALCCDPELTSIDNKLEALCSNGITALMGVLNNHSVPLKSVFSAELIKRGSTRF